VPTDWNSWERMLRDDHLYSLGVVVDHNWADQTQPGKGSCIFLHVWRGPDQPTVGCTAMDERNLRTLLGWLDPRQTPTLVQLPEEAYRSLRRAWQLPEIDTL
jgi:D-alanyl-D-alanine dipeptidase